jgi:hypothetical protein
VVVVVVVVVVFLIMTVRMHLLHLFLCGKFVWGIGGEGVVVYRFVVLKIHG